MIRYLLAPLAVAFFASLIPQYISDPPTALAMGFACAGVVLIVWILARLDPAGGRR